MVSPNTIVHLLSVDLEEDQKNQMDFADASAQYNYFISKVVTNQSYTNNDFTYQRKDNVIRIPAEYDELVRVNYIMYQNTHYSTKWFYGFVTSKEYINANMTALHIKTDVFQTWQLEMQLKDSFVAREHVADDTPYKHTLPEPLPTPEYAHSSIYSKNYPVLDPLDSTYYFDTYYYVGIYATGGNINLDSSVPISIITNAHIVGGIPGPGYLFSAANYGSVDAVINKLVQHSYNILYTVVVPKDTYTQYPTTESDVYILHEHAPVKGVTLSSTPSTTVMGSHTIRNKKLNTYPYRYIEMTDRGSQRVAIKYELLNNSSISANFKEAFAGGASPSLTLACTTYAGKSSDWSNSITVKAFPPFPYDIDVYKQYMALHKNSYEVERLQEGFSAIKGIGSAAASIAGGDMIGAATTSISTALDAASYVAKYDDMKAAPPKTYSPPQGDAQLYWEALGFNMYDTYLTTEYANIVDEFFDKYGYNVSVVKTPQYNSRQKWNYIETKDINIASKTNTGIPQDDMQELKQIFNNGITIWHGNSASTTNWCNYNQSNPIVQHNP